MQNTHQIQVLTKPLCRAHAIFYSLPINEWGTKYRWLTYNAKQTVRESVGLPIARGELVCEFYFRKVTHDIWYQFIRFVSYYLREQRRLR